jgi:diacylglycerol kinase
MTKISFPESVRCAFRGLIKGILSERNLKVEVILGILIVAVSIYLEVSKVYFLTIIVVIFLVVILELFNKNFEKFIDLVSPYYNKEAGEIKDTMAGIVLSASLLSVIIGVLILYEPLIKVLKTISMSWLSILFLLGNSLIIIFILSYKRNNHPKDILASATIAS